MLLHGPTYPFIVMAAQATILETDYISAGGSTADNYIIAGASANYLVSARSADEVTSDYIRNAVDVFLLEAPD